MVGLAVGLPVGFAVVGARVGEKLHVPGAQPAQVATHCVRAMPLMYELVVLQNGASVVQSPGPRSPKSGSASSRSSQVGGTSLLSSSRRPRPPSGKQRSCSANLTGSLER